MDLERLEVLHPGDKVILTDGSGPVMTFAAYHQGGAICHYFCDKEIRFRSGKFYPGRLKRVKVKK